MTKNGSGQRESMLGFPANSRLVENSRRPAASRHSFDRDAANTRHLAKMIAANHPGTASNASLRNLCQGFDLLVEQVGATAIAYFSPSGDITVQQLRDYAPTSSHCLGLVLKGHMPGTPAPFYITREKTTDAPTDAEGEFGLSEISPSLEGVKIPGAFIDRLQSHINSGTCEMHKSIDTSIEPLKAWPIPYDLARVAMQSLCCRLVEAGVDEDIIIESMDVPRQTLLAAFENRGYMLTEVVGKDENAESKAPSQF